MKKMAVVIFAVLMFAALAQADVVYSFIGTYTDHTTGQVMGPVSFTLTLPAVLTPKGFTDSTPDATFDPGAQLTCDACLDVSFYFDAVARGFTQTPSNIVSYDVLGGGYYFYFAPSSFTVNGTYKDVIGSWFGNQGTLTLSGAQVATPEPGSLAMLAPALGLLGGWLRARRQG